MSLRFQQLQSEVFEDRALPSSVMISFSSDQQPTATLRMIEQSWSLRTAAPQYQAFFVNQQGYGVVPIGTLRDGGTLFMLVRVAVPPQDNSPFQQLSERLSSGATLPTANTASESTSEPREVSSPTTRSATRTTPNTQTNLMAYLPERSSTTNDRLDARRAAERPTADERAAVPAPATMNAAQPVLRDYSSIEQADVLTPIVLEEPAVPTQPAEPMEPDVAEPATEPATTVTALEQATTLLPLAGLLPFNVAELDADAKEFLQRVARVGLDLADDVSQSSEYWWLAAAAISAGGAILSTRPSRGPKPIPASGTWLIPENPHDNTGR